MAAVSNPRMTTSNTYNPVNVAIYIVSISFSVPLSLLAHYLNLRVGLSVLRMRCYKRARGHISIIDPAISYVRGRVGKYARAYIMIICPQT